MNVFVLFTECLDFLAVSDGSQPPSFHWFINDITVFYTEPRSARDCRSFHDPPPTPHPPELKDE